MSMMLVEREPPNWLVFQRVDGTCFVKKVASVLHSDEPSNGERVIAVTYHEADAELIVATINGAIFSKSPMQPGCVVIGDLEAVAEAIGSLIDEGHDAEGAVRAVLRRADLAKEEG